MFHEYDKDKDGKISLFELQKVLTQTEEKLKQQEKEHITQFKAQLEEMKQLYEALNNYIEELS